MPSPAPAVPNPDSLNPAQIAAFRRKLLHWYRTHARELPWRTHPEPYHTWVSEVMLQQTRVAAVIEHYHRFLQLFPTVVALALAPEADVLAAWSGLGYYRRARMLHKAAQFLCDTRQGILPETSAELKKLPGIGDYTCAAIASIAFGESIAVVDGNVERVLLRITGRPEDPSAAGLAFIRTLAGELVPQKRLAEATKTNAAGDHNQAMMELGATICLPRAPLCLHCPVFDLCRTRGEHLTTPRGKQISRQAAFLLSTRKLGASTEVLLERRGEDSSLMPNMFELPPLPLDAVEAREPILRLRHSITNTNYYVQIFAEADDGQLRRAVPAAAETLCWHPLARVAELPLTGLARKALKRLDLQSITGPENPHHDRQRN